MSRKKKSSQSWMRISLIILVSMVLLASFLALAVYYYSLAKLSSGPTGEISSVATSIPVPPTPFPVSVDSRRKLIVENSGIEEYLSVNLASNHRRREGVNWFDRLALRLTQSPTFQQLASPFSRTLVIFSGERKEEVVDNIGDILRWDNSERLTFENLVSSTTPALAEGKFFPGNYTVGKNASPEEVAVLINTKLNEEVLVRYSDEVEKMVPFSQAVTIASLLEREAYDFEDMRYISGIIWNRLFIDMNLQLDATLQYVKGEQDQKAWWPNVVPNDKYLNSPYNTYKNEGLPPTPIANPSVDAILAALNPRATDCLFYFHDDNGGFHCTNTYEEHVALLKKIYGQGR